MDCNMEQSIVHRPGVLHADNSQLYLIHDIAAEGLHRRTTRGVSWIAITCKLCAVKPLSALKPKRSSIVPLNTFHWSTLGKESSMMPTVYVDCKRFNSMITRQETPLRAVCRSGNDLLEQHK